MTRSIRNDDIKSAEVIPKTPFGRGVKLMGTVYVDFAEIQSYINRELAKGNKSRDAILTNLQAALNTMHRL